MPGKVVPPPPAHLPINTETIEIFTELHRIYDSRFEADSFNPAKGKPTRFAPLFNAKGDPIPTLYAGNHIECAIFERIFHDVPFTTAGFRTVSWDSIDSLSYACLLPLSTDPLTIAKLYTPDLNKWGIDRDQLIDTTSDTYPDTIKWAEALHAQHPNIHGLVWTSRQCDPHKSYVLFGDRVGTITFHYASAPVRIREDADILNKLIACADRAGITITDIPMNLPALHI